MQCKKTLGASLAALVALVLMLLSNVPPAKAHAHVPATTTCNNVGCSSEAVWGNSTPQFSVYGAQTNMTVSNPTLQAGAEWYRLIQIEVNQSGPLIVAGLDKVGSSNHYSFCSGAYSLELFIWYITPLGTSSPAFCRAVPSGDINAQATFKISQNPDSSYDVYMNFKNGDGPCNTGCSLYNISAAEYFNIRLEETLRNESFSNAHLVWGSAWGYNEWQSSKDFSWHFQGQANCQGIGSGGCAVQNTVTPTFYWHILPQNSSTGGEIYSCEYDPLATSCNYGS